MYHSIGLIILTPTPIVPMPIIPQQLEAKPNISPNLIISHGSPEDPSSHHLLQIPTVIVDGLLGDELGQHEA